MIVTGPLSAPVDGEHIEFQGFRNLTPHALRICGPFAPSAGADIRLLPWPDLPPVRLAEATVSDGAAPGSNGFSLRTVSYAPPPELPAEAPGVYWIISLPALMGLAAAGCYRADLLAPDTSVGALRDAACEILDVQGFVRLRRPTVREHMEDRGTL